LHEKPLTNALLPINLPLYTQGPVAAWGTPALDLAPLELAAAFDGKLRPAQFCEFGQIIVK